MLDTTTNRPITTRKGFNTMKKLLTFLLSLLALTLFVVPAAATPIDELDDLAESTPADSAIFITVRADDAFIETLDGLLNRVREQLPEGILPPDLNVRSLLDQSVGSTDPEATFESLIGSWLGDTIGISIGADVFLPRTDFLSPPPEPIIMSSVADRDGAVAYVNALVGDAFIEYTEGQEVAGGTLWTPVDIERYSYVSYYYLTDDTLYVGSVGNDPDNILPDLSSTLADSEAFNATVDALPLDDYNALIYNNVPAIVNPLLDMALRDAGGDLNPTQMQQLAEAREVFAALGPQAFGFTLLDGRSLTIDFAQTYGAALVDSTMLMSDPISTDFTNNLPADTALLLQDTALGTDVVSLIEALDVLSDALEAQFPNADQINLLGGDVDPEFAVYLLNDVVAFARLTFQGLTGESIEDAFGWMTGDYANYVRVVPFEMGVSPDIGLVVENTDSAEADELVASFANLVREFGGDPVSDEAGALAVPTVGNVLARVAGMDPTDFATLDLLVGYNDTVFGLGLRDGIQAVLAGEGGLAETDAFSTAEAYFLPETQALAYIAFEPFAALAEQFSAMEPNLALVAQLVRVLDSASITSIVNDADTASVRFVITLSE